MVYGGFDDMLNGVTNVVLAQGLALKQLPV